MEKIKLKVLKPQFGLREDNLTSVYNCQRLDTKEKIVVDLFADTPNKNLSADVRLEGTTVEVESLEPCEFIGKNTKIVD